MSSGQYAWPKFSMGINNLLIDAEPLIALFNKSDKHHQACISFLSNYQGDIFTQDGDFSIYRMDKGVAFNIHLQ
jgi:hypothetical protein